MIPLADRVRRRLGLAVRKSRRRLTEAQDGEHHRLERDLLGSEGLVAALWAVERSSAIPVAVETSGLGRYGRSIEETVYFCVLETIERARMSGAAGAHVEVARRNGHLVAEIDVSRVGTEIDLQAVGDRLDAAGGTLIVEDRSNGGARVVGSLPITIVEGELV